MYVYFIPSVHISSRERERERAVVHTNWLHCFIGLSYCLSRSLIIMLVIYLEPKKSHKIIK